MSKLFEGLGVAAGVVLVLTQIILFSGTSMGVVREHCLDLESSTAAQAIDLDSGWTYILWPPMTFANLDPSGRCVRNAPLREALSKTGIWRLPSPEEQVVEHLREQGAFGHAD